jgi:hypothetical protein
MPDTAKYRQKTENIKVSIETSHRVIIGTVHPPAIAYKNRLSDLLNQSESAFLSVTDVEVFKRDNPDILEYTSPYVAVNIRSIETVRQLEDSPGLT